ncbi:MAG: elongation factor P [Candidatus Comchoanobacterales bacterium]
MATNLKMNDLSRGKKLMVNNEPHNVVSVEFVKPGKGQAFARLKLKNYISNKLIEKTIKSNESFEEAEVKEFEVSFLYMDEQYLHVMEPNSFEQYDIDRSIVADETLQWLKEDQEVMIVQFNGEIIGISLPQFIVLEVVEADDVVKGNTVSNVVKEVVLETGTKIKVPAFIKQTEKIKIDTELNQYVERVNEK